MSAQEQAAVVVAVQIPGSPYVNACRLDVPGRMLPWVT
jgi:hypothetical protein